MNYKIDIQKVYNKTGYNFFNNIFYIYYYLNVFSRLLRQLLFKNNQAIHSCYYNLFFFLKLFEHTTHKFDKNTIIKSI